MAKCSLIGLNVPAGLAQSMSVNLGCSHGNIPFTYLGMPIGSNTRRCALWEPVVQNFKDRLSGWKAKLLSFGGRHTLVTSVLNSLLLYYFTAFRAPSKILELLEQVIRAIFGTNYRDWASSCARRSGGGKSCIWAMITSIGSELDNAGVPFTSSWRWRIADGAEVSFWFVSWCGDVPLANRFPRLMAAEANPRVSVRDRVRDTDGARHLTWEWTRPLRGRSAADLESLTSLVNDARLGDGHADQLVINLEGMPVFSVKSLRSLIESKLWSAIDPKPNLKWSKMLPKKMNICIWRIAWEGVPVREKLHERGIDLDSRLCPRCLSEVESLEHVFVHCPDSDMVWSNIAAWWPDCDHPVSILNILYPSRVGGSKIRRLHQAVMWAGAFIIWKRRNLLVFRGKNLESLDEIRIRLQFADWIKSRAKIKDRDITDRWFP